MPCGAALDAHAGAEAPDRRQPRPHPLALFPYQDEGVAFLAARRYAYLADDPGLGKTAQVVRAAQEIDAYRILVIPPASLKVNWWREMALFGTPRRTLIPGALDTIPDDDRPLLCIVNYDIAIRPGLHHQLASTQWDLLVCDESHALKNPYAKRTRAVLGQVGLVHSAAATWFVSGTPAPNHVGELYPALAATHPAATRGLDYDAWLRRYCVVVPGQHGPRVMGNRSEVWEVRTALDDWMLRRRKADVLKDLPPLRVGTLTVENDQALAALNERVADDQVLAEMERLEALLDAEDVDEAILDAVDEAPLSTVRRLTGEAVAHALVPLLQEELAQDGRKVVLMAWHKRTLDILGEGLAHLGTARIDGSVPHGRRQQEVDRFQGRVRGDDPRVFLGQILAAGTGHTLTAAADMLIVEPSWVPGENAQAMLRIHRIGQHAPCLVRYVSLAGSLSETIMRVAARKAALLAEVIL